jgi:hypothetical protein
MNEVVIWAFWVSCDFCFVIVKFFDKVQHALNLLELTRSKEAKMMFSLLSSH